MFKPYYTFVYGTLMRQYGNHRLLQASNAGHRGEATPIIERGSEFIGEAITIPDCYTMLTGGFPYVLKDGISHVKGELYLIKDEATANRLDMLEGVPSHHVRHETTVKISTEHYNDDTVLDAVMYVASPRTEKGLKDHPNYVKERTVVPNDDNVLEWSGPYTHQTARSA